MGAQIHISGYGARGPGPGRTRDLGPGLRDPHISTSTCRHSCIHTNISKHSCIFTLILYISAHPHINMTTCPHTKPWTSRNRGGPTAPPGPPALRRHSPTYGWLRTTDSGQLLKPSPYTRQKLLGQMIAFDFVLRSLRGHFMDVDLLPVLLLRSCHAFQEAGWGPYDFPQIRCKHFDPADEALTLQVQTPSN